MDINIALIPGDGIGPEVIEQTIIVLEKTGGKFGHTFAFSKVSAGGSAIDTEGIPLPDASLEICKQSDAVLLGAVGGPQWDHLPGWKRPEKGLLKLRRELGLFANIRPAFLHEALKDTCPLHPDIVAGGIDICVVRELTGGIYFGTQGRSKGKMGDEAFDTERYSTGEVERIARMAFDFAMKRGKKVTSVDKANVLESSRLWRSVVSKIAKGFPEVRCEHMYVDNAAMQLIRDPGQFDVLLTTNMFGDILSDEASMLTGSIGILPSASLGKTKLGLYEPVHGSAPDIAGKDAANPIANVLSAVMMLQYSFGLDKEAKHIESAVTHVLEQGFRTADMMSKGKTLVGTKEMGRLIGEAVEKN